MLGTILNGLAILFGGIAGIFRATDLSPTTQQRAKIGLALAIIYVGFSLIWRSVNGTFGQVLRQLAIVMLALIVGNLLGKLLRLQKAFNRLGRYAKERFSNARPGGQHRSSDGFLTCSLLFCAAPIAILGALEDGLTSTFKILAVKSVMDGMAAMAFAKTFGASVLLSAIPVVAYEGTITLAARVFANHLANQPLLDSITATIGFLTVSIALIVLELKKVQSADYLPSLIFAPLFAWFWR